MSSNEWDDFVRQAQGYINTERLKSDETEYKVDSLVKSMCRSN